ncbi:PH domain-containing protein [Microbacterium sp. H37-C3]|uniref:PH domain-containing protein n=1 Tax=Microbacterium sp. H37-C3 TaxID=3004354 RepID=UPI0022B0089F|nr:PH domain-containing protein [Microbacterium sp. H37-C3]MCZ4067238.1 PH domain-containing protein [Microbacterium sp. H37-C3]
MTDPVPTPPPADATVSAPPAELVRSPLSDGEWHRLHPLTPLLRGGLALLVVLGIVVANMRDRLISIFVPAFAPDAPIDDWEEFEAAGDPIGWVLANNLLLIALLVTVGVLALIIGAFYLSWRFHTFRITDDDVEVRSGILSRTHRRAPLDRVQGVNLTRPAVARLLGAAKLEIVGAGADANVKLEYLSTGNAETIRADILRLASGQRLAEQRAAEAAAGGSRVAVADTVARGITGLIEGDDADAAEPESVVRIPPGRLIGSQLASWGTVVILAGATALAIALSQGVYWVLFAYFPALLGFGAYWVRTIVKSLRYSIAPTRDGVRVTFGLLTTVSEILPPGRIHAVEITQSILWRGFGWWTIRINRMTGRSASDTTTDQFTTVLPVGTLAEVERVLGLILPSVSEEERAAIVRDGVLGGSSAGGYVTTPRRARIVRPLSWRRNGLAIEGDLLMLRRGLIWRMLAVLPLARLQSVALHQGPVSRALRVATLRAHTVSGPVLTAVAGIDRDDVIAAFERVAHVAVSAAASDRSHRWAEVADAAEPVLSVPRPEPTRESVPATPVPVPPPAGAATELPPGAVPPPPYVPPRPDGATEEGR